MIRVLVVDDSALVRKMLSESLSKFDDIEVVGTASDPYVARDKVVSLKPDVMTLDIEMPRMDGLTFLSKLMRHYPMPVVVVSSVTPRHGEMALRALELGAVEIVPKSGSKFSGPQTTDQLVRAIRAAASARVSARKARDPVVDVAPGGRASAGRVTAPHCVIAIGASTGGTRAIEDVLTEMPADAPGVVIVQHMPPNFTASFADRLNKICRMQVREAKDLDSVVPGTVLIGPGDRHMTLHRAGSAYSVRVKEGPQVHHQRPSVDVLFHSVARAAGSNAVGVLLTGMGADGADGLLAMRRNGAHTIAEDESTCVVFGMPKEAIRLGAAVEVRPLSRIAARVLQILEQHAVK